MEQSVESQPSPQKKRAFSVWHLVTVLLMVIVVLQMVFIFMSLDENMTLNRNYNSLAELYSSLQSNYTQLQANNSRLKSDLNASVEAYSTIRDGVNLHSKHPTEAEKLLVTPDDEAVETVMLQVTGGWSDPSDWNEYWNDMKSLYGWVLNNINYTYDAWCPLLPDDLSGNLDWSEDNWQFPNETLIMSQGDCDDQAILLLSLVLAYDSSHPAYCIVITGHTTMYIPVSGGKICVLDPTGRYTTNNGWPHYDLAGKPIRDEINNWTDFVDNGAQVNWIFSNTLWKQFSGTEDFIAWASNS